MKVSTLDRVGVTLSTLCVIHCLILPLLMTVLPLAALLAEDERVHKSLVILAVGPAIFAFTRPLNMTYACIVRALGCIGLSALFAGAFIESFHDGEKLLTVMGAFSLAFAHMWKLVAARTHGHVN